ncbi:zinc-dependent peptidase [Undibacterium fentianense]|uniref:Zinc-dependent peptidase n=1 Tax=Undibacterium fentianense TaxID=2828728 RepID=A0A941IC31_9BURK|nr:M90 family metallopeptidase [Undibacterium fentianense]MBR7798438.1 zinc-dependent peptidase [Undibacterium fentianense]
MWALVLIIGLALAFFVWPKLRLYYVLNRPFPSEYRRILRKNVPGYIAMPTHLQMQLKRRIRVFLSEKTFVGCGGFEVNDEVRLTIAGKACLLLLNREIAVFPRLSQILVYPGAFIAPRQHTELGGVVTHTNQTLSGESWSDGRVILAWDQVANNPHWDELGQDVVIHEFAHQLDSEDGSVNGAPILNSREAYRLWSEVMAKEYAALLEATERNQPYLIDRYGATNPGEFFAVTSEAFFKKAHALAEKHPRLFELLRSYYQVDPREWQ